MIPGNIINTVFPLRNHFTLLEHLSSSQIFSGVRVTRSLVLCVCFVDRFLYFFYWPLCCLFVFDIRILITPLLSSNSSYICLSYVITFVPFIPHFLKSRLANSTFSIYILPSCSDSTCSSLFNHLLGFILLTRIARFRYFNVSLQKKGKI